jgi:hypothetical protein
MPSASCFPRGKPTRSGSIFSEAPSGLRGMIWMSGSSLALRADGPGSKNPQDGPEPYGPSGWPMRRHGKMTIDYEEIPFQFHGLEKSFANIADLSLSNPALPVRPQPVNLDFGANRQSAMAEITLTYRRIVAPSLPDADHILGG